MEININEFFKQYVAEYEALYETQGYICGYDEAVEAFDDFLPSHQEFVAEFANLRGDFISSEREAAAFMFALETIIKRAS